MADRPVAINNLPRWPGTLAAGLVGGIVIVALAAVIFRAEAGSGLSAADWAAVRFTVVQAALSATLSVIGAIPLARALARTQFRGRAWLITLLGAPFLLPVIVAVMGLLVIFGRNGWFNMALQALGLPGIDIYGLHGVVLAPVLFNLPLATRLLLQGWQDIPAEQFRLAAQLNIQRFTFFRILEAPMLTRALPGAWALVFVVCLTSFAVALILGGGPKATTIELAIYQAFRLEFDLGRAALLSVVQMVVALVGCLIFLRFIPNEGPGAGLDAPVQRWDRAVIDKPVILLGVAFILLPLIAILSKGAGGLFEMPSAVWRSAGLSVLVALGSTVILLLLALPIATLAARVGGSEAIGVIGLATSPLLLGTGFFIILFPFANPASLALPITALVNAIMTLPFALRVLVPGLRAVMEDYGRLSSSLGLKGYALWRIVILPRLRRPLGFTLGLAAALSLGDLGVIALFADPERTTLPLQIERLRGAYRTDAASGAALLLAAMSFTAFWLFDRWGRRDA